MAMQTGKLLLFLCDMKGLIAYLNCLLSSVDPLKN